MSTVTNINVTEVKQQLSKAFNHAVSYLGRNNSKGSKLHTYQVDMAYMLNELEFGPIFARPHRVHEINMLIKRIHADKPSTK